MSWWARVVEWRNGKNDRSGPGELVYKNQVVRLGEVILDALINTLGTRQEFNYTQTVNEEGQVSFYFLL